MAKEKLKEQIDVSLHPMRSLLAEGVLDDVHGVLREILPNWSKKLAVRMDEWSREKLDASRPGKLDRAVRKMIEPGETYQELEEEFGPGPYDRETGHVTLTGAYRGVLAFLHLDDWVLMPIQDEQLWGNGISWNVTSKEVEGIPASEWVVKACEAFCKAIPIGHGFACSEMEYQAKNKIKWSYEGLDPTRHLPGMYWLNYFGAPYVKLIGRKRLMSGRSVNTWRVGTGIMMRFGDDPLGWRTRAYRAAVTAALDHVGRRYFFDRTARRRQTLAPRFRPESDRIDKGSRRAGGTVEVHMEEGVIRMKAADGTVIREEPLKM
jgi:hypothetical protein